MFKILFLGDVVGKVGRRALKDHLAKLKAETNPDLTIVNGENSAGGIGIEPGTATEIFNAGADIITTGNHVWGKREVYPYLDANAHRIVRPHNFAPGAPGKGVTFWTHSDGTKVAVVNLIGRVFMPDLVECPFRAFDALEREELNGCKIVFVDFHGEATSEKVALGYYLDGRATAVVGTHTHVQTADNRVLPGGTAYISDVGMCGPAESVIGVDVDLVIEKFLSGRPVRFDVAGGPPIICGVVVCCDRVSGHAHSIERILLRPGV